jgi:hypothetical protein
MGVIKLHEAVQEWGQRLAKVVNCAKPLALAKDFSSHCFEIMSKEGSKGDARTGNKICRKEYKKFSSCPAYEHIKVSMTRIESIESEDRTTFEFSFAFRFNFKKIFDEVEPEKGTSNLKGGYLIKHFKVFDLLEQLIYDSGAFPEFCVIFWDVYYTFWKHKKFETVTNTALTWANPRVYFDYEGALHGGDYKRFTKRWDNLVTSYAMEKRDDFVNLLNLAAYRESRQAFHDESHQLIQILDRVFVPMADYAVPDEWLKADEERGSWDPWSSEIPLGMNLGKLEEYEFELPEEYWKVLYDLEHAFDKQVSKQVYKQIAGSRKEIKIRPALNVVFTKSKIILSALLDAAANMPILIWALREELANEVKRWITEFITGYNKNLDKLGKSEIAKRVDIDYSWTTTDTLYRPRRK